MRNCLIIGCGRSGTSMLSGILHQAGYFMGEKLYSARDSNPKGFFEWKEINRINEEILSIYGRSFVSTIMKRLFKKSLVTDPGKNQRWLLYLHPDSIISNSNPLIEERIKRVIKQEPYCYKDPRFSYTLSVWRRFLKSDTVFICVFREPNITVESILKECRTREYLADLFINKRIAYKVWASIYSYILSRNTDTGDNFFFVHYNQIYNGEAIPLLSNFLHIDLKGDFVDKKLKRTVSQDRIPGYVKRIYYHLCELAKYKPDE